MLIVGNYPYRWPVERLIRLSDYPFGLRLMQWVAIKRCVCLLVKRTVNDFDSANEKRAFIYDSLGLLAGPDLSRVTSYRRGLSLFFLFPLFSLSLVLLSFYCRSIVVLLSFYCRFMVSLLLISWWFFVFLCCSLSFKVLHFYLCYFLSLFELCEEPLSAFRYNRSLSVGRYHIVVISPFLSRFPLSFSFDFFSRIPGSFPRLWLICC